MRILIVEDEKYIARAIAEVLRKQNYTVDLTHDGMSGLDYALSGIYDAIVLDIMLPGKNGLDVLAELRSEGIKTPVILLTAKGELSDKVKGLDTGADDYLVKPFHTDELLARLRALSRRQSQITGGMRYTLGNITLDISSLKLFCGEQCVSLKPKEAQVLEVLLRYKGRYVSKNCIYERVWGYDSDVESTTVEKHISELRRTLSELKANISIENMRGIGYAVIK